MIIAQTRDSSNSNLSSLINQLDVSNIIYSYQDVTFIISIIQFALSLFVTLIVIILLYKRNHNKAEQIQFSTLGNIFIRSIRILYWILCYLLLLVSTYNVMIAEDITQFLSMFVIIFVVFFTFFHDFLLLNDNFNKQDFLNIAQPKPYIFTTWIKLVQCGFSSYFYKNQNSHMIYLLISFALSFLNYIQLQYFMVIFGKYDIDQTFHLVNLVYFGQSLGFLIQYLINIEDPYTLTTILIIINLVVVHNSFRKWYFEHQFANCKDVSIRVLLLHWFRELNCSNVYYMGIIIKHQNHPNNKKCFLRQKAIYYSGKKFTKYTNVTTKKHNIQKYKGLFVKFYTKCLLETQLKIEPNSSELRLLYAEILFYKFSLINESFKQIQKIKSNFNFNQQLRIIQLKLSINNKLKDNNSLSYRSKLPFENMLKCEEQMKDFVKAFLKITELSIFFWKGQLGLFITIQNQINISQEILNEMQVCQSNWRSIHFTNPIDEQNMFMRFRWRFFYLFFKLYILHKKLKVQELKELPDQILKSQQIFQDEKIDERSSSEDETQGKVYYQTNCIISSNNLFFRVDKFGEIIAVSQSSLQLLGRHQNEYRGARVEILMPDIIKMNHNYFLKLFYKTGQSENLYKRRSVLVKHSKGHCFKAQKYLKYLFNLEQNRFEYFSMLRKVSSRSQYIILNSKWEMDSSSEFIYQIFGEFKLPFLSLCPKAISYTEFAQYLTTYDMKILSLKLCSFGSRERIQDRKFTFRRQNDQTFSNKSIHEFTSLVFKRELEEKQKQNVVQIFQQVLEEDNEIDGAAKLTKLSHIKLNIRVPLYKAEFQEDYNKYDTQMNNIFYSAENLKRLIFRNGNGKIRVDKFEFIQRYRWVKDQRMKFIYSKIKYLFEHYCQEQVLEKVLKVDANLKFYKTLNKTSFYIIKINRLELYDETTNNNEKQDMQFINTNSFKPYTSALVQEVVLATQSEAYTLKNQSGYQYSDMEFVTNRDNNFKPLLIGHSLREDFLEQGSNTIYSLNEQHNPFIKEEINKISKRSHKLSLLFFLNRLLFFLEILLICFTYFFCSYYYNPLTLHNSVTLLGHVYKISLITVQSYNYIIDVGLMNENKLTSLLIVNPTTKFNTTEQFLQFVQTEIEEEYLFIYNIYTDYDFVSMVYSGFYIDDSDVSGLDIFDQYQLNLLQFNFSEKGTIDLNNTIILHFRDYMVPYGLQLMQDSIVSRINEAILYQTQSIDNLILFMIFLFSVLIINSIFSLVIKYQFRNDVNTIYNIVANIPKQDKIKAMMQHQTLFTQLNALFEEEQYGYKKPSMHALNADTIIQQDFEIIEVEKANQKRNKAKIIMLPKYQLNVLISNILDYYCSCILFSYHTCFIYISLLFHLDESNTNKANLFGQQFFSSNKLFLDHYIAQRSIQLSNNKKFIYDNYLNSSFYPNITQFRFQEFLDDMAVTSPLLYQTTISDIQRIFDETLCDFYSYDESATYIYYEQFCSEILNGALKRGLKQFNILLSQVVIKALNPYDERYDDFKIDDLAQYQISFQIIYEIFQKSFEIWALDAENLLSQTSNLSLVSFIIQLLVIIVLYFSLLEYYLFTKLQNDFNFSKNYYRYFMLNQTMNQVKTMRVDMIRTGLLSK